MLLCGPVLFPLMSPSEGLRLAELQDVLGPRLLPAEYLCLVPLRGPDLIGLLSLECLWIQGVYEL